MAVLGGLLGWLVAGRPTPAETPVEVAAPPQAAVQRVVHPRLRYRNAKLPVGLTPLEQEADGQLVARVAPKSFNGSGASSASASRVIAFSAGRTFFSDTTPPSTEPGSTDSQTTPSDTTGSTGGTTTTAPVGPPIQISDVHTVSLAPFSATIAWHTSEPVSSRIAYGFNQPSLWTAASTSSDHVAVLSGLAFSHSYNVWVTVHAADGRTAESDYMLTTPALSGPIQGSTGGGALLIDGQPIFPTMVFAQCTDGYDASMSVGIDLFMGDACSSTSDALSHLDGRAFALSNAEDGAASGNGLVGSYLPDEWDTHLPGDLTTAQAEGLVPDGSPAPRFLTLTSHFFSGAAPLPQGRAMYPALAQVADVLGFDLYPLQNWCRYDDFGPVYDAQRELVQLAAGKPTFQWIEARHMDCSDPTLGVTPQTVHAETWLAIAGGAHAIGYFPYSWTPDVGSQISQDRQEIDTLSAALLEAAIPSSSQNGLVKVGARDHNGAVYVIAVNSSREPATSTITVPELGNRTLISLDGTQTVTAANGSFTDNFGPLDVHIYIAAPQS
jgi:hypothetical protein